MNKILGLTIIASFMTSPAWAGDTFVRNETIHRTNRTETSLEVDTVKKSNRTEHYNSYSEKITFSGNGINRTNTGTNLEPSNFQQQFINDNSVLTLSNIGLQDNNLGISNISEVNGLSIHRSGSSLEGTFVENINTRITGTIYSVTNESFTSHETTAGVR
ncbi:MAG: hypothetical protein AAFO95_07685 [Cyanobacteria bacterium J06600_6]